MNTETDTCVGRRDLAKMLGVDIRTVRRMDREGRGPRPIRISSHITRYAREEVAAYLSGLKDEPPSKMPMVSHSWENDDKPIMRLMRFKPPPATSHWAIRKVFDELSSNGISMKEASRRSGVLLSTLKSWKNKPYVAPNFDNIERVLAVVGYGLTCVKVDKADLTT